MSFPVIGRAVEGSPFREPQSALGPKFAASTYRFFLTGTNTPANVYQDGALTTPFPITGFVTSDNFGRFPPIYLDTSVIYKVQFYDKTNTLKWAVDPYTSQLSTVGTSSRSAYGMNIATTGEIIIPAPNTGGSGVSLTLNAGSLGSTALKLNGTLPGNSALIVNNSATTGAQTATFQANNKPGPPPTTYNVVATLAPSGATYTGGNLTSNFTGVTGGNYTVQLSTGQDIFGVTFTNGSTTFITPSTNITGTPTAALIVTVPVTPAWWLPITCDGVQYYTPIWHGSSQSQFLPSAPASPSAQGQNINAQSVLFGGSGLTTATGGTATPSNWLVPTSVGAGAGYYINITKTGGLSGLAFTAAQGAWTNITAGGLTISGNAQASITGTYQLSTSVTGLPVVANGTITLSGNNGVQQPTYNGATPLVLAGNGTSTLNGVSSSNWFAPTTANVGASYYVSVTQTGGAGSFTGLSGVTNITNGGLTIGVTGTAGTIYSASGTYSISSDAAGLVVLGSGNITLTGGSLVQSPNWSGTTPLKLNGDGSATLNGAGTSSWYSPNASSVGSGYWINITRTSGTTGVNFTAAQGSWTNITNSGLTIDMAGYTGDVGTVSVGGTWQISNSSSGTPVLGSGTISLSVNAGTVTRTYNSGSGTETVPTGASLLTITVNGAGGGGSGAAGVGGGGGGGGSQAVSINIAVSGGQTLNYSVPAGGIGATINGGSPAAATVTGNGPLSAVNISAGSGVGAANSTHGAAGTASGGNSSNTSGSPGSDGGAFHGITFDGNGGNSASGAAGGTASGGSGTAPGGGGAGSHPVGFGNGAAGSITFAYS